MLNFLLPSPCLLCAKNGRPLCLTCLGELQLVLRHVTRSGFDLYYLAKYNQAIAKIVLAIKEKGQTALIPALLGAVESPTNFNGALLVPIPSSKEAERKRGFSHTEIFAKQLIRNNPELRLARLLKSKTKRLDQAGLSFEERKANLSGAFEVCKGYNFSAAVVLVDDVYTSGASMSAAKQALEEAGFSVLGGWVLALVEQPKTAI